MERETPQPSPQQQFKEAASVVAAGLRETGQSSDALAAARLQEASRFVERVPHLAGINKENVDKAIDAAAKVPALSARPELEQLRSAATTLTLPIQEQQRASVPVVAVEVQRPEPGAEAQKAAAELYKIREPERQELANTTRGEEFYDTSRQEYSSPEWEGKGGQTATAKAFLENSPNEALGVAPKSTDPQERFLIINTTGNDIRQTVTPAHEAIADRLHEAGAGVTDQQTRAAQGDQPQQGQIRVAYQMNQPTLDAIHHEIEQLRGRPGVEIIAPEALRTERAEVLATQYAAVKFEQQQERRDEAAYDFSENLKPVVQGLRAHGDELNAARLQDVAKFVERTGYIGGINKENVDKAIGAADKVPGLSESKELRELKSAVSVLEKEPAQERSAPSVSREQGRNQGGVER